MKKVSQNYLSSYWGKDGSFSLYPCVITHSSEDPEQQEETQDPLPLKWAWAMWMAPCTSVPHMYLVVIVPQTKGFRN